MGRWLAGRVAGRVHDCSTMEQSGGRSGQLLIYSAPCTVTSCLQECMAVEHELAAWQKAGGFSEVGNALR